MKHVFTTGLFLFALIGFTFAQDADDVTATGGPNIEFESRTIDYGTIEQHSDGNREFKFSNTGDADLIIQTCKGSCGCTVPQCPREVIAPGESGVIKVKYATDRLNPFTKFVTVNSNDTDEPSIRLTIKGKVLTADQYKEFSDGKDVTPVDHDDHSGHDH